MSSSSSSSSNRKENERTKLIQEKCQNLLNQLLRDEDNKFCVDCDSKGPRWASWNLGVFLCIRCAGIHRNLGVHISRVKSVNLDTWTPEQVVSLEQMGNSRARAVYEAQLPDGFRRPQSDTALESFIRAKYEHKKYLAREWVPPSPPKVDWGREVDEEIEKQKRKKKSQISGSNIGGLSVLSDKKISTSNIIKNTPLPAPLPKPKSSNSPKISNRIDLNATTTSSSNTSDLLGLSSPTTSLAPTMSAKDSSDTFTGFLSAPVNENGSSDQHKGTSPLNMNNSLAKEEEDFFNQTNFQTGNGERDKNGKLTKDSILALYGSPGQTSTNQLGQFNNNPLNTGFNSLNTISGQSQNFMSGIQSFPTGQQFGGTQPNSLPGNLSLNLAGMPQQGLMGPQQPQHHQFMTPPSMYNAPVMTAPGAFNTGHFFFNSGLMPSNTFSGPSGGAFGMQQQQQQQQQPSSLGNSGLMQSQQQQLQQTTGQQPTNLNQLGNQFGNLNLGNVWQ